MHTKRHFSHAKIKGKQWSQNKKSITIKVPAELKKQIDDQRKLTGQTISQIVERAVVNLLNAEPGPSLSNADQELQTKQLREITNDLRFIVHKLDKIAAKQASHKSDAVNLVVVGNRHASQNDPQKERIYKLVKAMHRIGANVNMIASGLNIEGIKNSNQDGHWQVKDVEKILEEIKQENDYLPPIYTLPEEP
ncbi:MAG: ribbon-helix-helix protein, CopG family [Desulfobacterales bacterium]|jgi:predicted DNA-binding protein